MGVGAVIWAKGQSVSSPFHPFGYLTSKFHHCCLLFWLRDRLEWQSDQNWRYQPDMDGGFCSAPNQKYPFMGDCINALTFSVCINAVVFQAHSFWQIPLVCFHAVIMRTYSPSQKRHGRTLRPSIKVLTFCGILVKKNSSLLLLLFKAEKTEKSTYQCFYSSFK